MVISTQMPCSEPSCSTEIRPTLKPGCPQPNAYSAAQSRTLSPYTLATTDPTQPGDKPYLLERKPYATDICEPPRDYQNTQNASHPSSSVITSGSRTKPAHILRNGTKPGSLSKSVSLTNTS